MRSRVHDRWQEPAPARAAARVRKQAAAGIASPAGAGFARAEAAANAGPPAAAPASAPVQRAEVIGEIRGQSRPARARHHRRLPMIAGPRPRPAETLRRVSGHGG
jgi:hypothetical protein